MSGCMLDVANYSEAMEKFGEEADVQEKQWITLQENMLPTLPDCIWPCSRAMLCIGTHLSVLV